MDENLSTRPTGIIVVADSVAREKNISREDVLEAMELALSKAAKMRYGQDYDIRASVDRKAGDVTMNRYQKVVADGEIENHLQEISLGEAQEKYPNVEIGEYIITQSLPPIEHGRIAAQAARGVIVQKVREIERQRQYDLYKDRVGEIVNGTIKRIEYGNATIDLGDAEALLRRDEIIPREHLRNGDRIRAYILDIRPEQTGAQIFLSRTHPEFMRKLFEQEVPEVYDQLVTIKSIARDPGSRAKISVHTDDPSIDPVGACVGMRGSRVQAVVTELQGEKIDVVPWNSDVAAFIIEAIRPANVAKIVVDEEKHKIEIAVPEDQLSLAIGRRGQNVRLASMLTGWEVDILTEQDEIEKRKEEQSVLVEKFTQALDIDDMMARLLITEGFDSISEMVTDEAKSEIATIEGFDGDIAEELQNRAKEYTEKLNSELRQRKDELGIAEDLQNMPGLDLRMIVTLGEAGVKTLVDFAELSGDELINKQDGILRDTRLSAENADKLIMAARVRAGWFTEEELQAESEETESKEPTNDSATTTDVASFASPITKNT